LKDRGQQNAEPALAAGSTLIAVSLLLFSVNLFRNGRLGRILDRLEGDAPMPGNLEHPK